jgi:hypothetical protein
MIGPMAIQIDDDWKKQAQAEKKKLAEREAAAKAPPAAAPAPETAPATPALPEVGFGTLIQSIMSQALYYLGEMSYEGEQPVLSLDMADRQIRTLSLLEEKTKGNLTADESSLLDQVLYDLRSRFVSVARQMIV